MGDRPKCIHLGCNDTRQHMGIYRKDGTPLFRNLCSKHHNKKVAEKHGLNSMHEVVAKNAGFASYVDYANSKHSYRKHRKNYCENIDGRLGYICNYPIKISAQLQVDHVNGDPSDDREENCQTLCANCHTYKTHISKDYSTPGRKKMKTKNQNAILVD